MKGPDEETFRRLASAGALRATVWQIVEPAPWPDPADLFAQLAQREDGYIFETRRRPGDTLPSLSIIGLSCKERFEVYEDRLRHMRADGRHETVETDDPLHELSRHREGLRVYVDPALPPLSCGPFGYFGFDTVRMIEPRLRRVPGRPSGLSIPDACLVIARDTVVLDHDSKRIFCIHLAGTQGPDAFARAQAGSADLARRVEQTLASPRPPAHAQVPASDGATASAPIEYGFAEADYRTAVGRIHEYIAAGDVMQVVLSQRMSRPYAGGALTLFRAIAAESLSPYRYLLQLGDAQVVGASPEMLFRLHAGHVTSRPMAGTRRRGRDDKQDGALASELMADAKELAEHTMLVDLARNDLGRIAQAGAVTVDQIYQIEMFPSVMHIVSTVSTRVKNGKTAEDVLRATFPAGTLSGASKVRALEVIAELEPHGRGIYGGAIGMIDWNGNADLAIAIRTAVLSHGKLHMQAGAGVVQDSRAEREWQETLEKSRAMLEAAGRAEFFPLSSEPG